MKVLSLFDGISCARIALERVGIEVENYYASEVNKYANSKYSICTDFDSVMGKIRYYRTEHNWKNGTCERCGASETEYSRSTELETHAYKFIHTPVSDIPLLFSNNPSMKFDVIIGNPPYQLSTGGTQSQAVPIYHKFVEQAKKLNPRYLTMIIPSRWFAGGMGLDSFRNDMLTDNRISKIVDFTNAKDCFPGISLGGGVNYFLWEKNYKNKCDYTSIHNGLSNTKLRKLNDYDVFVRYNEALDIINKVLAKNESSLKEIISSLSPYGIGSAERGGVKPFEDCITLYSSKGPGYISLDDINNGLETVDAFKVMISKVTSEHAGEPNKDGKFKVFSKLQILKPKEVCTFSYFIAGSYDNINEANNLLVYLQTKFVRFLLLQAVSSINLSKDKFQFVPLQDFTKSRTDAELYEKYGLSQEEIDFIESMIRPME